MPVWSKLPEFYFFFQAEDGIRDLTVTGVQTCALPISHCGIGELRYFPGRVPTWKGDRSAVLRTLVLGIVQGLTEFLPISSSAHLSIVPKLLGFRTPELAFDVLLHFGTLAAVVVYFARDLWSFVLSLVAPGVLGPQQAAARRRQLGLLVVASIPAAVFGYLLQNWADAQTSRPLRSAVWLVLTTLIMIAAELWARSHPTAATATTEPARPAVAGAFEE